jgi:hypothetical protein
VQLAVKIKTMSLQRLLLAELLLLLLLAELLLPGLHL